MNPVNQSKLKDIKDDQFEYLGRWVDKKDFRAFVYDDKGEQKLADSYNEYELMISSGLWFSEKPKPEQEKVIVQKGKWNDPVRANGK